MIVQYKLQLSALWPACVGVGRRGRRRISSFFIFLDLKRATALITSIGYKTYCTLYGVRGLPACLSRVKFLNVRPYSYTTLDRTHCCPGAVSATFIKSLFEPPWEGTFNYSYS